MADVSVRALLLDLMNEPKRDLSLTYLSSRTISLPPGNICDRRGHVSGDDGWRWLTCVSSTPIRSIPTARRCWRLSRPDPHQRRTTHARGRDTESDQPTQRLPFPSAVSHRGSYLRVEVPPIALRPDHWVACHYAERYLPSGDWRRRAG